jgi:hypothetical protein
VLPESSGQALIILKAPQWILSRPNPYVSEAIRQCFAIFPIIFMMLQNIGFAAAEIFYPLLGKRIPRMNKNQMDTYNIPENYHPLLTPSVRFSLRFIFLANSSSLNPDANAWYLRPSTCNVSKTPKCNWFKKRLCL